MKRRASVFEWSFAIDSLEIDIRIVVDGDKGVKMVEDCIAAKSKHIEHHFGSELDEYEFSLEC